MPKIARQASYPTRRRRGRVPSRLRHQAPPAGAPHVARARVTSADTYTEARRANAGWNSHRGRGHHKGGRGLNGGLPDTWVNGHAASYVVKRVRCGKPRCGRCARGGDGHGPYKYLVWKDDGGRVRTKYAGRA